MPGCQLENHGFDIHDCPGPDLCMTLPYPPQGHADGYCGNNPGLLPPSPDHLKHSQQGSLPRHCYTLSRLWGWQNSHHHHISETFTPQAGLLLCPSEAAGDGWVKGPGFPPDEETDAWQVSTGLSGSGQWKDFPSVSLCHLCPHTTQSL